MSFQFVKSLQTELAFFSDRRVVQGQCIWIVLGFFVKKAESNTTRETHKLWGSLMNFSRPLKTKNLYSRFIDRGEVGVALASALFDSM